MASDEALDVIARGLARGMSRREALRAGGAALIGGLLTTPGDAWAKARGRCRKHHVKCGTKCCPPGEVCVHPKPKKGKHPKHPPKPKCQCPKNTKRCKGKCVHFKTDAKNCGRCGHKCGPGQHCAGGKCVCPEGTHPLRRGLASTPPTTLQQLRRLRQDLSPPGSVCAGGACVSRLPGGHRRMQRCLRDARHRSRQLRRMRQRLRGGHGVHERSLRVQLPVGHRRVCRRLRHTGR